MINAGIWPAEDAPLHEVDPDRVREVLEVNLLGAIWTARAFVRALAQDGPRADGRGASVCLIGSTAGRFGEAGHLEYAVSKSGLYGLMRSLKNEIVALDPYARVNLVEPGWTVTPMAEASLVRRVPDRPVVGREDHERVVGLAVLREGVEQATDLGDEGILQPRGERRVAHERVLRRLDGLAVDPLDEGAELIGRLLPDR